MQAPRKKILIISYYFPPSGGPGVQRVLKFVKYLREFGWEPVVLTARDADYPVLDESLLTEVPDGVRVYRARIFEPYRLYRVFTGKKTGESVDIATVGMNQQEQRKISERLSEWVRASFFVPDARIWWLPFAVRLGREIIKEEKIDVLMSSAPPYTTHLIGLTLQRYSGLPWVADFRDSWIGWVSTPQWRPAFSRTVEMRMERSVLRHAGRILTVSRGIRKDLLSRHPEYDDERWLLLPNGFDAADFDSVRPKHSEGLLTITYSGSLYGPRNPTSLLGALEALKQENPKLTDKIRIRLVGRVGESIVQGINRSSVSKNFEIVSYVQHKESLSYILGSDISLLIVDEAPVSHGIIPGKVYEYIGAGNPILAVAPEGEIAELIRSNDLGCVVAPKDVDALKETLRKLVTAKENGKELTKNNESFRKRFERREHTRELAKIIDELDLK